MYLHFFTKNSNTDYFSTIRNCKYVAIMLKENVKDAIIGNKCGYFMQFSQKDSTCNESAILKKQIIKNKTKKSINHPYLSLCLMILSMMGMPKARVFPVPVLARPIMSRPCIAGSSTAL